MQDTLVKIHQLVASDLSAVDATILENCESHISLIKKLSGHIIQSGGKRLRPLVVILGAKAFAYQDDHHIPLAAAMEYFHTATLLHDDVVDESTLRRGRETAHEIWGSKASVLVGDYMFTRAMQLMLRPQNLTALQVLTDASNTITRGEVLQLLSLQDPKINESQYMQVIHDKTAILFAAAAKLGAILCEKDDAVINSMHAFGLHLGNAFQIVDDILDYSADENELGKHLGDDLSEGKMTLPLIYTMKQVEAEQKAFIEKIITERDETQLAQLISIIRSTDALEMAYQTAKNEIAKSVAQLDSVPESIYRDALYDLTQFAIARRV